MSTAADQRPDRAAAVRAALRKLVAERGFHGASMSAVATEARVATGTAYVHYASKDDLVHAAYLEAKRELGLAAVAGVDASASPRERFHSLWMGVHGHLVEDRDRARFLVQVDASPYRASAHEQAMAADGDPLMEHAARPDMRAALADLPPEILYDLGLGPAVRLAATGAELDEGELEQVAAACWRAVSR